MIGRWLCKRKVRKALITELLHENTNLRAMLKAEQGVSEDVRRLHAVVRAWLGARIAFHLDVSSSDSFEEAWRTTKELERVARRCFLTPGMKGSWGRGVPRVWDCDFDPKGGGCECAGGGLTDAECRHCFYRRPMGEKKEG